MFIEIIHMLSINYNDCKSHYLTLYPCLLASTECSGGRRMDWPVTDKCKSVRFWSAQRMNTQLGHYLGKYVSIELKALYKRIVFPRDFKRQVIINGIHYPLILVKRDRF